MYILIVYERELSKNDYLKTLLLLLLLIIIMSFICKKRKVANLGIAIELPSQSSCA